MNIQTALKLPGVRLSAYPRWLVCDLDGEFTVYERSRSDRKTKCLVITTDEDFAIKALLEHQE